MLSASASLRWIAETPEQQRDDERKPGGHPAVGSPVSVVASSRSPPRHCRRSVVSSPSARRRVRARTIARTKPAAEQSRSRHGDAASPPCRARVGSTPGHGRRPYVMAGPAAHLRHCPARWMDRSRSPPPGSPPRLYFVCDRGRRAAAARRAGAGAAGGVDVFQLRDKTADDDALLAAAARGARALRRRGRALPPQRPPRPRARRGRRRRPRRPGRRAGRRGARRRRARAPGRPLDARRRRRPTPRRRRRPTTSRVGPVHADADEAGPPRHRPRARAPRRAHGARARGSRSAASTRGTVATVAAAGARARRRRARDRRGGGPGAAARALRAALEDVPLPEARPAVAHGAA